MKSRIAVFLIYAVLAVAQTGVTTSSTTSGHTGWSSQDTLASMTDVVVIDIQSGRRTYQGPYTVSSIKGRLVRILQGDLIPGAELSLAWQILSSGPPLTSMEVPPTRALFFLRQNAGSLEVLQAPTVGAPAYYVELPRGPLPVGLIWQANQHPQIKLADELAWALEDFSANRRSDLKAPAPDTFQLSQLAARQQFDSLATALNGLDPKYAIGAFYYLSVQIDPNIRLIGLQGRMRAADFSAVLEIEGDLPHLSTAYQSSMPPIMGFKWSTNLPAAHALARVALADITLRDWDFELPYALSGTGSLEFLPYLRVMLDSPRRYVRDSSMRAMCDLLRWYSPQKPGAFWLPAMQEHCPFEVPIRDNSAEQKGITFWRSWYADHLEELRKEAVLPRVASPSRYSAADEPPAQFMQVPIEVRFQSLVGMATFSEDHVHTEDGAMIASSHTAGDPFSNQMDPADREAFRRIVETTAAKLEQVNKTSQELIARMSQIGQFPEKKRMEAFEADRQAALKTGLSNMRSQLSSAAWTKVEKFLLESNIVGAMPGGGPKK